MRLCAVYECEHQYSTSLGTYPVSLHQQGRDRFRVTYGGEVKSDLDHTQAALELGSCLMHQLACAGKLDNRGRGEK